MFVGRRLISLDISTKSGGNTAIAVFFACNLLAIAWAEAQSPLKLSLAEH
jgi:hypothetical protein